MARGELMKKLLSSYGRDDEFRGVVEQIISEEEKKNNRVVRLELTTNGLKVLASWHFFALNGIRGQ